MIHYTWFAGSSVLGYCDDWGEKLAWFFGITSPKYYYELVSSEELQMKLQWAPLNGITLYPLYN